MRMKALISMIMMVFLLSLSDWTQAQSSKLMPGDIIRLHQDGVSSDGIIERIKSAGIGFEVTLPIMEEMMQKGISQGVLEVMLGHDMSRRSPNPIPVQSGPTQAGITISTDPPGLTLTIDGQNQGVTPSLSNKIKKGKHTIKVEHPLFFTRQEEIEFDGANDVYLRWKLEPREPIIRVSVNLDRGKNEAPWSWIIRPRNRCPGCDVNMELQPWQPIAHSGEAIFLLNEVSKRSFRGDGVTCLELNIWQDEVRRDLPIRNLPPPDLRYYITDIRIGRIEMIDVTINIRVKDLDKANPEVTMQGISGYLMTIDEFSSETPVPASYDSILETLDGVNP